MQEQGRIKDYWIVLESNDLLLPHAGKIFFTERIFFSFIASRAYFVLVINQVYDMKTNEFYHES